MRKKQQSKLCKKILSCSTNVCESGNVSVYKLLGISFVIEVINVICKIEHTKLQHFTDDLSERGGGAIGVFPKVVF